MRAVSARGDRDYVCEIARTVCLAKAIETPGQDGTVFPQRDALDRARCDHNHVRETRWHVIQIRATSQGCDRAICPKSDTMCYPCSDCHYIRQVSRYIWPSIYQAPPGCDWDDVHGCLSA